MNVRIRLLYAEDNALDADLTRVHFEQHGQDFELDTVETGSACLAQIEHGNYDVLLLDNHLPDMDGLDVLKTLRADSQNVPVVLVTGVGDDSTVASALRAGASDYVPKNGDYLSALPLLLRTVVARQRMRKHVESEESRRIQRVLYVEPNAMDAELAAGHFAEHAPSLQLQQVASCVEALQLLSGEHDFDLVLTDLRVPGMDALEFIHEARLRQIDVPFIVITGKGDETTAVALLRLGASDYLVKREDYLVQLPHAIENALRGFRLDKMTRRLQGELEMLNSSLEQKVLQRTIELRDAQSRLRATFIAIPDLIWQKDTSGRYQACNPALEQLLGLTRTEILGRTDAELFDPPTADLLREIAQQVFRSAEPMVRELSLVHRGSRRRLLYEVVSTPIFGETRVVMGVLGVARDISEHKAREERIQQLAHFDALTGLPNRVLLNDRINNALSMAQRKSMTLAVLLLDLDHFKNINDNLGHSIGDLLLIELAARLRRVVREEDTVSRLGGDEFLLLLPGADAGAAAHVAEKLMEAIAQPCQIERHELVVTPSIGIAMYPNDGEDYETLSRCADVAMYRSKQAGRNGFCFFTPEMQARSARELLVENALRQALKRDQLRLHYQPQLSFDTGRIVGVEALLRWQHPELGAVSPAEFIPIAESSGQIMMIGEWVLRQALRQLKQWMDAGLEPVTMAVNLSAVQFRHARLPELVSEILREANVSANLLQLELTEGVTMGDTPAAIAQMGKLHAQGVTLAIDDFGTGYSSLSHLKRFKIGKLKIDQSFVQDIAVDPDDRAIVGAIISMAKSLGIQTIAEGVETEEQRAFLRDNGCDQMQGYHLSRPLPGDAALAFMQNYRVV